MDTFSFENNVQAPSSIGRLINSILLFLRIAVTRTTPEDPIIDDFSKPMDVTSHVVREERRAIDPVPGPSRSNSTTQSDSMSQAPKWFKRFLK